MSQDEAVTGPTLRSVVEELYSCPTGEFTTRRKVLSVAARSSGDRELAAQIAALRKPTLSADTLNRLVRAAPEAMDELLTLGSELRTAEKALDAAALRALSGRRRSLVNDLAQLAFEITEQATPSASTKEEVVATLNAALADGEVAERLMSGSLVTQARWDGFGSSSLPELAAVIPMLRPRSSTVTTAHRGRPLATERAESGLRAAQEVATERAEPARDPDLDQNKPAGSGESAERAGPAPTATDRAAAKRAAAQGAALEQARVLRLEAARTEAGEAERAATAAAQQVADIDRRISELGLQIAHQRQLLAVAQRNVRSTEMRRRAAQQTLTRAGGRTPD